MHWKISLPLKMCQNTLSSMGTNACIFDILYVFNYICVFCNWDFSGVIKFCKVFKKNDTSEDIFV